MSLVLLSGCATGRFNELACPDVVKYPDATLDKAASEMEKCQSPTLCEMVVDYGVMRDQARNCEGTWDTSFSKGR